MALVTISAPSASALLGSDAGGDSQESSGLSGLSGVVGVLGGALGGAPGVLQQFPGPGQGVPGTGALPQGDLTCPGAAVLNFDPGLTPIPSQTTITGTLHAGTDLNPASPCTSLTGVPYQGATVDIQGSGTLGCVGTGPTGEMSGTADIQWDNGDQSVARWSVVSHGFVPVVDVTIVEGPLAGSQVISQGFPTGFTGNCVVDPLTTASFAGSAVVLPVGVPSPSV